MAERLEEIKARLAAATPGPWEWDYSTLGSDVAEVAEPSLSCMPYCYGGTARIDIKADDAQFIAHSREDIAWLIAQLEPKPPTRARCKFEWRCQDCPAEGEGKLANDVRTAALEHWNACAHRVQMADWNGWHRP
jgi:hypothetical protein